MGDGSTATSPGTSSATHLESGQKPAAQFVLHHAVIVASPEMLVHDEAFAASAAGEGCGVLGRLASGAANEAAAPMKKSMAAHTLCALDKLPFEDGWGISGTKARQIR